MPTINDEVISRLSHISARGLSNMEIGGVVSAVLIPVLIVLMCCLRDRVRAYGDTHVNVEDTR